MATMFQCVRFWGWKALEGSSCPSDSSAADKMTAFQATLCSVLVRKLRADGSVGGGHRWLGA